MTYKVLREIKVREEDLKWLEVGSEIFRSWTGPRRIDSKTYGGPVYFLGTNKVSRSSQGAQH